MKIVMIMRDDEGPLWFHTVYNVCRGSNRLDPVTRAGNICAANGSRVAGSTPPPFCPSLFWTYGVRMGTAPKLKEHKS